MLSRNPRALRLFGILAVELGLTNCANKEADPCGQAHEIVKKSVAAEDFGLARRWRDYAGKQCDDESVVPALEKQITEGEAKAKIKKLAETRGQRETPKLLQIFRDFVAQNRLDPAFTSTQHVACDAPRAPATEESKERFCTARRALGSHYAIEARFWASDHSAFRFTTRPIEPVDCQALGGSADKTWDVPAVGGKTAKRSHCKLTGPLEGLDGVVTAANNADLHVYSAKYLERDPAARPLLLGP